MANNAVAGSSPATLENVARSILAGIGNDSPSKSQLIAVEAQILAEKPAGNVDAYSNNPLNIATGNLKASQQYGWLQKALMNLGLPVPDKFPFSSPTPNAQPSNPIVQFPDLTTGIAANSAGLSQPFAKPLYNLLAKPQEITTTQYANALGQVGWTDPGTFLAAANAHRLTLADSNAPYQWAPGAGIGVDVNGRTPSGVDLSSPAGSVDDVLGNLTKSLGHFGYAILAIIVIIFGFTLVIVGERTALYKDIAGSVTSAVSQRNTQKAGA